jgi:hypothetical protein
MLPPPDIGTARTPAPGAVDVAWTAAALTTREHARQVLHRTPHGTGGRNSVGRRRGTPATTAPAASGVPQRVVDRLPTFAYVPPAGSRDRNRQPQSGPVAGLQGLQLARLFSSQCGDRLPVDAEAAYGGAAKAAHDSELHDEQPNVTVTIVESSADGSKQGEPDEAEPVCTVCLCEYEAGDELRRLPCFHAFHRACIDAWMERNATCPVCRARVELVAADTG